MGQIYQMLNEKRILHLSKNNFSGSLYIWMFAAISPPPHTHTHTNSYVENLMPNVVVLVGGASGKWLGLCVLIEEAQESSFASCAIYDYSEETAVYKKADQDQSG